MEYMRSSAMLCDGVVFQQIQTLLSSESAGGLRRLGEIGEICSFDIFINNSYDIDADKGANEASDSTNALFFYCCVSAAIEFPPYGPTRAMRET